VNILTDGENMNAADAIELYIKLRDKKTEFERKHKEELAPIKEGMEKLENWLHRHMLEEGTDSVAKRGVGTAYLQRATSVTVKDWDAALDFIVKNNEWAFLEARVSKAAVRDYLEQKGELPPGVNYTEALVVRVNR